VWWPAKNASIAGTQPFKAEVLGMDANAYSMYWQVDGGQMNAMATNDTDGAHKEANVDVSGWHWQSSGAYTLTFTAKDASGATIASYSEPVLVNTNAPSIQATPAPVPTPAPAPTPVPTAPLSNSSFYANPNSSAASQANAWASSRPADAAMMRTLANAPTAAWFGEWSGDVKNAVAQTVNAAAAAGKTAVLVAYDIPQRDCGGYSAGGTNDYLSWITAFANGIGSHSAVVILEPDSLAQVTCLSSADQATRYSLLAKAVSILKANSGTKVYLDAGHAGWIDPATMAARLGAANIAQADGFSLNVSNYDDTASEAAYGAQVSAKTGSKHFVIDTSRNGNGSDGEWCNASGRAIGAAPTTSTGNPLIDAFLWVKTPGESDGTCNGGPSAGTWWADYALSLVKNVR
jgi:endoglucanase